MINYKPQEEFETFLSNHKSTIETINEIIKMHVDNEIVDTFSTSEEVAIIKEKVLEMSETDFFQAKILLRDNTKYLDSYLVFLKEYINKR